MLIHLIASFLFVYLAFRCIPSLPVRGKGKALPGLLLLLVSQQHLLNRLLFGGLAAPELPALWLKIQGGCFLFLLLLAVLTSLRDAGMLILWLARRGKKREKKGFSPGRRQAIMAVAAAVPAVYGVRQAVAAPEVRDREVRLPRLPHELDGLTIVQVSDLHISPLLQEPWVRAVVERVQALDPDLIVFTGDLVDGSPERLAADAAPLRALRARYGVFACPGNHEYYSDYTGWMRAFPELGVTMLENSHNLLLIHGKELAVAGVTDRAAEQFSLPMPDSVRALEGVPGRAVRILLEHRPSSALSNALAGVDLQLSGHTHGGQIIGMDRVVAGFNNDYLYGWYTINQMRMYVSSGAGLWNGFPVRLGVPSEIARIVLRSGG